MILGSQIAALKVICVAQTLQACCGFGAVAWKDMVKTRKTLFVQCLSLLEARLPIEILSILELLSAFFDLAFYIVF